MLLSILSSCLWILVAVCLAFLFFFVSSGVESLKGTCLSVFFHGLYCFSFPCRAPWLFEGMVRKSSKKESLVLWVIHVCRCWCCPPCHGVNLPCIVSRMFLLVMHVFCHKSIHYVVKIPCLVVSSLIVLFSWRNNSFPHPWLNSCCLMDLLFLCTQVKRPNIIRKKSTSSHDGVK